MNVRLFINTDMQKYLYEDLYNLEETHWWHKSKRELVTYFLEKYFSSKYNKILDVGCGTGKNMEQLQKYGNVWGLDNSKEAIKFCRKRGLKNLQLSNAEKTKFKANSFDIITLLDVLEHTDDNKTLKEMQRILKKNGILIITVPAFMWLWSKWDEVLYHKRRYDLKSLTSILKNNNFRVIKITYLYSFLVLPALIIRGIKEKLLSQKYYPSDFLLNNSIINKLLGIIANIEFNLAKRVKIPIGTSLLVIAKK